MRDTSARFGMIGSTYSICCHQSPRPPQIAASAMPAWSSSAAATAGRFCTRRAAESAHAAAAGEALIRGDQRCEHIFVCRRVEHTHTRLQVKAQAKRSHALGNDTAAPEQDGMRDAVVEQ